MGLVQFIINKLAGYDIISKQKHLEQAVYSLQRDKERLAYSLRQTKDKLVTVEKEKTNSDKYAAELKKLVEDQKKENMDLSTKLSQANELNEDYKKGLIQGNRELNAYKLNFEIAKKGKEELKSRFEEVKERLEKDAEILNQTIASLTQEKCRLENVIYEAEQEKSEVSTSRVEEIRDLENQIQTLQEQLSDTRRVIDIQKSKIEQKDTEIKDIGQALTIANKQVQDLQEEVKRKSEFIKDRDNEIKRLEELPKSDKEDTKATVDEDKAADESISESHVSISNVGERESPVKEEVLDKKPVYGVFGPVKSKEDEVIEMCGSSMMDFPPIINDSNRNVQRSIEYVFDKENHKIYADAFFGGTAEEIARKSRQLEEDDLIGKSDFVCGMCHRPVKIAHRTINGKESLFFAHAHAIRNENCAWIPYSTSSNDDDILIDNTDIEIMPESVTKKPHSQELKEMIFTFLCTSESEKLGISDVKCDEIIKSVVPYMKWRRPDISFKYKDKDVVIVMQRKKHDLGMLVDRDVYFRLNNCHVIWIFGADNDITYDYMRMSNYKNTMFDCHRNVFVFDLEAQQKSKEKNTLCLKYNWLDENDNWAVVHDNFGCNGFIADISNFIFDDEYCKPYIKEANEPYFRLHPEAKEQYLETRKSREQLMKEFEGKWKGEPSYEEAIRLMKLRGDKAKAFLYMGLWGFRFNNTTLIQPVFTEQPEDLHNGFFMVKQGETAGIVDYYGEVIMDWTKLICDRLTVDVTHHRVMFFYNGVWGVSDYMGNILIKSQFSGINPWTKTIYRVRTNNLWGLQSIEDKSVTSCIYDSIGEIVSGKAQATYQDKEKSWIIYKGWLDSYGNVIDTNTRVINDKYTSYEQFAKWGIRSNDGKALIMPTYQEILSWRGDAVRVESDGKWGVINIPDGRVILEIKYDAISEFDEGKAQIKYVGVTNVVDENGQILSEESIKLQDGFVKSKIGGKWGIEKNGIEIVPHKYDEIGAFRQRLIGIINSTIVKLNAYYDYPIHISGRCIGKVKGGANVNVSGVLCFLPNIYIKQAGLEEFIQGHILNNIAFSNLIFSKKQYLLRIVLESKMQKKTNHGDKNSDFDMNEIVTGSISGIMKYKTPIGKIKTTKVKVKISDGRETMIPRRFFVSAGLNITDFNIGDVIRIQKTGFDDELDQTIWRILGTDDTH